MIIIVGMKMKRNEHQTEEYTTNEINNIKKESYGMKPNEGVTKDIENKNRCN